MLYIVVFYIYLYVITQCCALLWPGQGSVLCQALLPIQPLDKYEKKKPHMHILGRDTLMYREREENVKGVHNKLSG